jgi:hypothetical protein
MDRGCSSGVIPPPGGKASQSLSHCSFLQQFRNCTMGRGLLLWLLGIPIPVIILLYVFHVI